MSWIDYVLLAPIYCVRCRVAMVADVNDLCARPFKGGNMTCPKCQAGVRAEDVKRESGI